MRRQALCRPADASALFPRVALAVVVVGAAAVEAPGVVIAVVVVEVEAGGPARDTAGQVAVRSVVTVGFAVRRVPEPPLAAIGHPPLSARALHTAHATHRQRQSLQPRGAHDRRVWQGPAHAHMNLRTEDQLRMGLWV